MPGTWVFLDYGSWKGRYFPFPYFPNSPVFYFPLSGSFTRPLRFLCTALISVATLGYMFISKELELKLARENLL